MRARLVDWTLFVLVAAVTVSGFASWLVTDAHSRLLIIVHTVPGIAVVVPLVWKLRRVQPRITHTRAWDWKTPVSIAAAVFAIAALVTGLVWTNLQIPLGYPNGMHLHIGCGLALGVLMGLHMALRLKWPHRRDVQGRRDVLRWLGMLGLGAAALPAQDLAQRAAQWPGAQRRFTGSRHAGSFSASAMPVTNWLFDRPMPLAPDTWRLEIAGAMQRPRSLSLAQVRALPQHTQRATLDCTGGWHSTQEWRGVRVDEVLALADVWPSARFISMVSVTGYRWSFAVAEASHYLLATHYGAEPLAHWHGAPLRLVAPGRRGFQWVKWLGRIEVREVADPAVWLAIFTSGPDRRAEL